MAQNGISTLVSGGPDTTKVARRAAKLAAAAAKRATAATPGFRTLHTIVGTHSAMVNGNLTVLSGSTSPTTGHPWS